MFKKQKIAAVGTAIVFLSAMLTTCSSSPAGATEQLNNDSYNYQGLSFSNILLGTDEKDQTMLEEYQAAMIAERLQIQKEQLVLDTNTKKVNRAINKLKKYVNKTWYVYSGSTPEGWDCSGLVKWTYEQIGIDLYHRASVQRNAGTFVKSSDAKPGDIVAFGWKGYSGAGHVGIYIGNGKMIHSPRPGLKTTIEDVSDFGSYGYSKITYTRLIETN